MQLKKTVWTEKRLQRFFGRYNIRYWRGKLPDYKIRIGKISGLHQGLTDRVKREILIDVDSHQEDLRILQTLLHEMAHAATRGYHGKQWLTEMRRLERAGAPIHPAEFRRDESLFDDLRDFVVNACDKPWSEVVRDILKPRGIIDSKGKILGKRMSRIVQRLKEIHRRERRFLLEGERIRSKVDFPVFDPPSE